MAARKQDEIIIERVRRIRKIPEHYVRLKKLLDELDPQGAPNTALPTELPLTAPELFKDRPDKSESVPAFVQRVWGPWLEAGLLTHAALRRHPVTGRPLDGGLRQAIFKHCRITGAEPSSIVPTKFSKGQAREAYQLLLEGKREEALNLVSASTLAAQASNPQKHTNIDWLIVSGDRRLLAEVDALILKRRRLEIDREGTPSGLPDVAPERWSERLDKSETVPQFLKRVWWDRGYQELLTQSDLRRLDSGLRIAIYDYCRQSGLDPAQLVSSKFKRGASERAAALLVAGRREEALALSSLRAIRNRLRKSQP